MFGAFDLDLGAAVLPDEHAIALLQRERSHAPVVEHATITDRDHSPFERLLLRHSRNENPAARLFVRLDSFHEHAVVKWLESCHCLSSPILGRSRVVRSATCC